MTLTCPHCEKESEYPAVDRINADRTPEMRAQVQDLSCFRVTCPNCGETMLALQPCLYHDMSGQFMVWLWPENTTPPAAEFNPLSGYTLRLVDNFNSFREKICVLELGLDDRAVEMMKLLLLMQLTHDLDVVELLFHEVDGRTGDFRFVAVLSDGVEQYAAMPSALYQKLRQDVEERLFVSAKEFARVDLTWAREAFELLQQSE